MTTWKFQIQDEPAIHNDIITRIELDRGSIEFFTSGGQRINGGIFMHERNQLALLFFAQQLISIIAEADNGYVLKNHLVVSARAINEYRHGGA